MRFRRLLRIFIPVLIIAAIVAGIIVVLSSRSDLQRTQRQVEVTWTPLRTSLDTRYGSLATANDAVKSTPGPLHEIVTQVDDEYRVWRNLERTNGSVASQVTAADNLEALGRRLVVAARAAPRLAGNTSALAAVNAYAALRQPGAAAAFNAAVGDYERERSRPARELAARVLGYDAVPAYDTSGSQ